MKKIFYGWWVVFGCFFISIYAGSVIVYGFTAFLEPVRNEAGWTYTQISLAASLRALEMGLLSPLTGILVDRYGARKLLLGGVIIIGVALILLSLAHSLPFFYGCFLILGIGGGGCMPVVTMSVVANWFHKKVGLALGLMASGMGASGLMIPVIVRLMDAYGWRTASVIMGVGMWVIGIPLASIVRSWPEPYGYLPDGCAQVEAKTEVHIQPEEKDLTFREAVRKRSFIFLNVVETIRMATTIAVVTHVMPYLGSLGIPRHQAGLVAGAISLSSILGRFGFGWLGDVFEKRLVMAWAFLFLGAGTFAFCYVHNPWILALFLFLFPVGFGGGMVLRGAILREYFGRRSFGKLIGVTLGFAAIGEAMGPAAAAWTYDTLGAYQLFWFALSAAVGFAIVLIWKLK